MLDPKKIVEPEKIYIVRDITEKNVSIDFKVNPNRLSIEEYTTVLEK